MMGRKRTWQEAMSVPLPTVPRKVEFKPKYNLPVLDSYQGVLKAANWAKWTKRNISWLGKDKSWVSTGAIRDLTCRAGFRDQARVDRVCDRLEYGANIHRGSPPHSWQELVYCVRERCGCG
jgi:hypothetical protein